jgi:hypothetical protein
MITKSKLFEIKQKWDKLEKTINIPIKVQLVKEIISLLDSEEYYEETADYLDTTTLKLRHYTILSLLDDEKFKVLLSLASGNLDLCFLFYRFPEDDLNLFIKTFKRVSSVEKLVALAADRLDELSLNWKVEEDNPWIAQLQQLDTDVWAALADDSTKWIDFKPSQTKKLKRFSTHPNQTPETWRWLYDLCLKKYSQGLISEKNYKGVKVQHHVEIIKTLSLN